MKVPRRCDAGHTVTYAVTSGIADAVATVAPAWFIHQTQELDLHRLRNVDERGCAACFIPRSRLAYWPNAGAGRPVSRCIVQQSSQDRGPAGQQSLCSAGAQKFIDLAANGTLSDTVKQLGP